MVPRTLLGTAAALATAGAAAFAVGNAETRRFGVRTERLEILPAEAAPIRILQLADIHFVPGQDSKAAWIRTLGDLRPDLIVNTGDNLSHLGAVPPLLKTLRALPRVGGFYVPGSNDYNAPRLKNPFMYFSGPSKRLKDPTELPWRELFAGFESFGWQALTNSRTTAEINGTRIAFSGVDDPHLELEDFQGFDEGPEVRIGVVHAPYTRVLDEMAEAGADLIIAGHTHGGQVCLPGGRALVSNCDLPPEMAKEVSSWTHVDKTAVLNVSGGLGQSRFAPVRLFCRPEAVLLELVARA